MDQAFRERKSHPKCRARLVVFTPVSWIRAIQAFLLLIASFPINAADVYPSGTVRILSGFAVGGSADQAARLIADELSKRLNGSFIVESKTGAGGTIAAAEAARAEPDGHTLLLGFDGTLAILPNLMPELRFDPVKDIEPVSKLATVPLVVAINPKLPPQDMMELITYSQDNTGKVQYGTSGLGTTPHLAGEILRTRAGMNWTVVPYRGGSAAVVDVISGTLPAIYASIAPLLPFIQSGQLKALGIASPERSPLLPGVPTFREQGLKESDVESWYAIFTPAGTPTQIVARLDGEIQNILREPSVIQKLLDMGLVPSLSSPEQVSDLLASDLERWKQTVQEIGLKLR